jgi:hypothetical protein
VGKIVTVEYVDDLDGVPVDAETVDTVDFTYRGQSYSLVLTAENGAQFDKDIARYVKAAKKAATRVAHEARQKRRAEPRRPGRAKTTRSGASAGRPRPKTTTRNAAAATTPDPERTRAIREWAAANGHSVSPRGRIAVTVIQAYDAAH